MTEKWVCRWCIADHGLQGIDLDRWPDVGDYDAIVKHIESEHHIPVRRDGETEDEASERMCREYPEIGDRAKCKCPLCVVMRALNIIAT